MTGRQHYAEAELALATLVDKPDLPPNVRANMLALAQVHATLALAAATSQMDSLAEPYGQET